MRYRTRSDANQKDIDKALRAVGASVIALGNVGNGCPDRLVGYKGETYLVETKNRNAKFGTRAFQDNHMRSEAQITFHETWNGKPVSIVYSIDDALKAIGAVR